MNLARRALSVVFAGFGLPAAGLVALACIFAFPFFALAGREETPFNDGWIFRKDGETSWRSVRVPHDWAIEGEFVPTGPKGLWKLPYAGVGLYRKRFATSGKMAGRCVFLDIGGAMTESEVRLNGTKVGERKYGYSSYRVDLTKALKPVGEENELVIRCDVPADSTRYYAGSGLYRPLRLVVTERVHVGWHGVRILTSVAKDGSATVSADVSVEGTADGEAVRIDNAIVGEAGLTIPKPRLWSPETPDLYTLRTRVSVGGRLVDEVETRFGVRTLEFRPQEGFFLNGKYRKLKGVCLHHDLGALGAAFDRGAFERQVKLLKEMGADAIRTTHNPPAEEVLEVCDEMGMMVMDEAFDVWDRPKSAADYSRHFKAWAERDLSDFIVRDRNHPSVVMWSIGNEIPGVADPDPSHQIEVGRRLTDICHRLDPTRPVTMGHYRRECLTNGMETATDIFGANYLPGEYGRYLASGRGRLGLVATETCSCVSMRSGSDAWLRLHNYPPHVEFEAQRKNPACYGEFVWAGFDYIGETDPWYEDSKNCYYGIFDLCGFPKPRYWKYRAEWRGDVTGEPPEEIGVTPACIRLGAERFRDLVFVRIEVLDAEGRIAPRYPVRLRFNVVGDGTLEGVGNGNQRDLEPLKGRTIRTYRALAQAIVRTGGGACSLDVAAEGLPGATIDLVNFKTQERKSK